MSRFLASQQHMEMELKAASNAANASQMIQMNPKLDAWQMLAMNYEIPGEWIKNGMTDQEVVRLEWRWMNARNAEAKHIWQ